MEWLPNFLQAWQKILCKTGQATVEKNCQFLLQRMLYRKDERTDEQFDFNNEQLEVVDNLINDVLKMLSARGKT